MVTFEHDIKPLFRAKDVACMTGFGVLLERHDYMADPAGDDDFPDHANARRVLCHLRPDGCTPRMPMHGPYWTLEQLALFEQWMADGFAP